MLVGREDLTLSVGLDKQLPLSVGPLPSWIHPCIRSATGGVACAGRARSWDVGDPEIRGSVVGSTLTERPQTASGGSTGGAAGTK